MDRCPGGEQPLHRCCVTPLCTTVQFVHEEPPAGRQIGLKCLVNALVGEHETGRHNSSRNQAGAAVADSGWWRRRLQLESCRAPGLLATLLPPPSVSSKAGGRALFDLELLTRQIMRTGAH